MPHLLFNLHSLLVPLVTPSLDNIEKLSSPTTILAGNNTFLARPGAFIVVITGRTFFQQSFGFITVTVTGGTPRILRLLSGLNSFSISSHCLFNYVSQMLGLLAQGMGSVGGNACLCKAKEEVIWKIMALQTVKSRKPPGPLLTQGNAIAIKS